MFGRRFLLKNLGAGTTLTRAKTVPSAHFVLMHLAVWKVLDAPLMYEEGWKKQLTFVIAFSGEVGATTHAAVVDEIVDVTSRYTRRLDGLKRFPVDSLWVENVWRWGLHDL